jgi:glycosyltransferase involved in cell wall biosynthesis
MEKLSVSVIIPTYNRAHLLKTTIPKYVQRYVVEIIIIDDYSTDNTMNVVYELIKEIPIIRYFRSEKKIRQTGAKNIGIKLAIGNYCFFGDDDSVLKNGSIESLVNNSLIYQNSLIASRHIYMNKTQDLNEILIDKDVILDYSLCTFYNKDTMTLKTYPKAQNILELPFCQACFLVSTAIAKKQFFNEKFIGTCNREETDFIMQLCQKGHKVFLDCNSLSIDLPKFKSTGGTRSVGFLLRHLGEAYNEYIFYKRNRSYLKKISTLITNPYFRAFMHLFNKIIK